MLDIHANKIHPKDYQKDKKQWRLFHNGLHHYF